MEIDDILNKLLNGQSMLVYGQYMSLNEKFGFLNNLITPEGDILINPKSGDRMGVRVENKNCVFKPNFFYKVKVHYASEVQRSKLNDRYLLEKEAGNIIEELKYNPYSSIIRECFERFNDPDSNKVIAKLLSEVGKGMYSSKKRMFFELLQNADDMPAGESVEVYLEAFNDYFLIMHNGLPFSKEDVLSITSAAESTKQRKLNKTGYKGIGFKSVFTDSEEVVIKSGAFTFKFDKRDPVFKDFDELYIKNHGLYRNNFEARRYFKSKYFGRESGYLDINSIPWQIKPIWIKNLNNSELSNSSFKINNNVGIALNFGSEKVKEYLSTINNLFEDVRFLLFLRNVGSIQLNNSNERIKVVRRSNNIVTIAKSDNIKRFLINEFNIIVSNEEFNRLDFDLVIKEKENIEIGDNQHPKAFFDKSGKELPIPSKLAESVLVKLHLGTPLDARKNIQLSKKTDALESCIYSYLPMNEFRFSFPFLLNADFVPSSNREEIQADNPWNHFLFYQLGEKLVQWVGDLALTQTDPNCLNLLLSKPLEQSSDIELLVNCFNQSYLKNLAEKPFILNINNSLSLKSEIIVDYTGFSKIATPELFYSIFGTNKTLINQKLDASILKNKLFEDVAKIFHYDLALKFKEADIVSIINKWIKSLDADYFYIFLKWLNALINECGKLEIDLSIINLSIFPFLIENQLTFFSSNEIILHNQNSDKLYIIFKNNYSDYFKTLERIGVNFTNIDFSDFNNILIASFEKSDVQINSKNIIKYINKISEKTEISLADSFKTIEFFNQEGLFEDAINSLPIFLNPYNEKYPLTFYITKDLTEQYTWLNPYKGTFAFYDKLAKYGYDKYLINETKILKKIYLDPDCLSKIFENYPLCSSDIYNEINSLVTKLSEKDLNDLDINKIPIVLTQRNPLNLKSPNEIWLNDKIKEQNEISYNRLKNVFEKITSFKLPVFEALGYIKTIKASGIKKPIYSSIVESSTITVAEVNLLLKFLVSQEVKEPFFQKWLLVSNDDGNIILQLNRDSNQYFANESLINYFKSKSVKSFLSLPSGVSEIQLQELKLLSGNELLERYLQNNTPTIDFYPFIKGKGDVFEKLFIEKLDKIKLSSDIEYKADSIESCVLKLILKEISKPETSEQYATSLRNKIFIGDVLASQDNYTDTIELKKKIGDIDYKYSFKISDFGLLDKSGEKLSQLMSNLKDWNKIDMEKLFKPNTIIASEIIKKAIEKYPVTKSEYTPTKILTFFLCYAFTNSNYLNQIKIKPFSLCSNEDKWKILNEFKSLNFKSWFQYFKADGETLKDWPVFIPANYVTNEVCALKSEILPDWIQEWTNISIENKKFIEDCGCLGNESIVVKLRLGIINQISIEEIKNLFTPLATAYNLKNTLDWIIESNTQLTNTRALLVREIIVKASIKYYVTKRLKDNSALKYNLVKEPSIIYYFDEEIYKEYLYNIDTIMSNNAVALLAQDIMNPKDDKFGLCQQLPIIKDLIDETRDNEKQLWDNAFYNSWSKKDTYKIFVYEGNIPLKESLFGEAIFNYEKDGIVNGNNIFYVSSNSAKELPANLYGLINNQSDYIELINGFVKQINKKQHNNDDEPLDNYSAEFEKIIKDFKDLDKKDQVSHNKEAYQKGIGYLSINGFDLSEAKFDGYKLNNASKLNNDGVKEYFSFFFNSAKAGLLFLNPQALEELFKDNIGLVVMYPKGEIRHFIGADGLINSDDNIFYLLRSKNSKNPEQLKMLIKASAENESHFIFVTAEELRSKLFVLKVKRSSNQSSDSYVSINPDDFFNN